MMPETNWAPKLDRKRFALRSANTASTSCRRPNTLTRDWPVKASSMWALSSPVAFHWATNSFCDRLPITPATSTVAGMVTRAIRARVGRDHEHHDQYADHGEQRGQQLAQRLLQGLGDVVDVVGDPAQQLAARRPVEVAQRQPVDLGLDLVAHGEDRALHRPVQQIALPPQQQRADHVEAEGDQQQLAERTEVDALAGHDVEPLHQVGEGALAAGAELRDHLLLGLPGGELLADHAR